MPALRASPEDDSHGRSISNSGRHPQCDARRYPRFKDIAAANDIVGDEKKRARFDNGEIDASGAERSQQPEREFYRQHAEARPGFKYERRPNGTEHGDDDFFADLFSRRSDSTSARGADVGYTFSVEFLEAINGAKKRVVMADGKALHISIPAGLKDGQTLRLRGQGHPGFGGADPGDALVEIHVEPHSISRREGSSIRSTLAVTAGEALAGAKVRVDTVSGAVELAIAKGSNAGTILRLRGKGAPSKDKSGDHLVELQIVLPDQPDEDLIRSRKAPANRSVRRINRSAAPSKSAPPFDLITPPSKAPTSLRPLPKSISKPLSLSRSHDAPQGAGANQAS